MRERFEELLPLLRPIGAIGFVGALMALSAAGVLSGLGLFLIAMIKMATMDVVLSSLLLAFSVGTFLACYEWLAL